ncbi:MAG: peptidoglycan-binding domain-containing protein, partial [Thermoleophilia bacterium]
YTRDLTVGSRGGDVSALQQVLISKGYLTAVSAPTGYFGPATKAALGAWQGASGISPTAGYFGPKTRAAFAAMGGTVGGGTTGGGTTGGGTVPAPASGLWVAAAATNPAAGSLISSAASAAARVDVLAFTLTAGNSAPVTVNGLKFKKLGVLSDSSISSAYLIEGGKVVAQYSSLNQGVLDFPSVGLSIGAGQTRTFSLAIDPATGLSAGNTVSFALQSVTASDNSGNAVTAAGSLPMNGNIFTVTTVSNPSIASIAVTSSSIATTVTAGTQGSLVGAWNFNVSNSKVWLKGVNFKVIGSANRSDLRNVILKVNGTQIGQTLAAVSADTSAYFDTSANPGNLNTGSNNIQVFADVMGSPSYNFQFEILNSYDILAVDSQYNVPVSAASNTGTQVSISQGQITVSQATNTPTGSIAKGQSGVTLAKFVVYAAGEAIKVKFIQFTVTFTGTTTTLSSMLKNVSLVDDAGGQLGTTINTPPSSNTCTDSGVAAALSAGGVYTDCFGTSSSNVNYIIPANTTRVLSLKADIQSTAGFSSLVAALSASSNNNLQGLTSSQSNNSSGATGSTLTLASNSLTVAKNSAVGTQTMSGNSIGQRIGSYAFSAASAEGVSVSSLNVLMSAATSTAQNLWVKVNGAQFGTSQGVLTASATYSFSGSAFTVPAGQTTIVDVYADILSSAVAGTKAALTTVSGCAASGASSYTAISCSSTAGQDIVVAGQASMTVTADTSLAAADQVVMNSSGNSLAYFRFTETTNIEDIKLDNLNIFQVVVSTSTVKSAFQGMTLYKSTDLSTPLATAGTAISSYATSTGVGTSTTGGPGYYYKFSFANPVVVPQGSSVLLVLKAGVASYSSSGATDNTTHVFKIATSSTDTDNDVITETVDAKGKTSNASSAVTLSSPNGSTMTVLRSKVSFTAAGLGQSASRAKAPSDNLASLTFAADSAGDVAINSVIVTFSGTAPSIASFLGGVTLLDESGVLLGTASTTSAACNGSNTCTKTFNLGSTTAGQIVTKGTSRTWTLRVDSTLTAAAIASISQTLTATINARTDIQFTDGLDSSAASTIGLASKVVVPITINSVSFSQGT